MPEKRKSRSTGLVWLCRGIVVAAGLWLGSVAVAQKDLLTRQSALIHEQSTLIEDQFDLINDLTVAASMRCGQEI